MHAWKRNVVELSLVVVAALGLAVPGAVADTITVCWDGSGQYLTIQEGIDAAKPGDEVVVCDGTYTGPLNKNLDFAGKAITVRSENGPDNCIIDCRPMFARGFYFHSGETATSVVDGFTITNGDGLMYGGGVYCHGSSPTITNCTIDDNWAADYNAYYGAGGGIGCNYYSSPTITNCTITENTAGTEGGGVYCYDHSSPTITNCTIAGNDAVWGGGVFCEWYSNPTITNCTITENEAVHHGGGGGICCYGHSSPTITNCILWADTWEEVSGSPVITYCDVQGGWTGTGNIDEDPLFVDPRKDDYHLQADSPCIDKGDPAFVPEPCETDMDGEFRVWDGDGDGVAIVDMGVDEFASHVYGDLNCDGAVDFDDIDPFVLALSGQAAYSAVYPDCEWLLADIDCDGAVNFDDIDAFVALLAKP